MNIITVVMLAAGATLIYAGIKNVDPRDVIKDALAGKDSPGSTLEDEPSGADYLLMPEDDTGSAQV
jgi:hypothetical protein